MHTCIHATLRECLLITQVKPTSGWRWSVRSWGRSSPPSAKWSGSRTTTPDHHLYYQTYFTIIILSGWLETFPHLAWVEVDNLLIGKKLARGHLPCNLSQRWCSLWCWSFTKVKDMALNRPWWGPCRWRGLERCFLLCSDPRRGPSLSSFMAIIIINILLLEIWNATWFCIF